MISPRTAIFTDIDGTLIDFKTYSVEVCAPRLRELAKAGVPVVLCSSKTRLEQQALMDEIGIDLPAIVENGSGLYLPRGIELHSNDLTETLACGGSLISWGMAYRDIALVLRDVSKEMDIDLRAYSDITDSELSELSGLSVSAAARARQREFSETLTAGLPPNIWHSVNAQLKAHGLQCLFGGRFYTVTSMHCNKGRALQATLEAYRKTHGGAWRAMALGDSANDYDMLLAADLPYLVQRPNGKWINIPIENLRKASGIGPQGWLAAVDKVFNTQVDHNTSP